jgi:hypothetical protein
MEKIDGQENVKRQQVPEEAITRPDGELIKKRRPGPIGRHRIGQAEQVP